MFISELFEQRVVLDDDIVVYKNPTHTELKALVTKYHNLRGMCDIENGPLYVWDAYANVHHTMHKYLNHHEVYLFFNDTGNSTEDYNDWDKSYFVKYTKNDGIYCAIKYNELKNQHQTSSLI